MNPNRHDIRSETVSARISESLLAEVQAIALARDTTVSDLICQSLEEVAQRERRAYEKLRAVFEAHQDLSASIR
jgi:antitoxin component of RelBE/YafQ-DinJ toxin-antitoxin module